jgi:hypothetical protein
MGVGRLTEMRKLIDRLYQALDSETLFSKVKEGSWQTFFHHSASVAVLAYKLGRLLKSNATGVLKLSINEVEKRLGITYEELLFLSGVAHDYSKVYGGGEKGRSKLRDLLKEFWGEESSELAGVVEALARTAEAPYTPELDENLLNTVSVILRVADMLMSLSSVDEAIAYIESSKDVDKLREYGIRFGFMKSASLTILRIRISEGIVKLLESYGWLPLVMYHDGLLLVGGLNSRIVPFDELYRVVIEELSETFNVDAFLTDIINRLRKKELFRLYQLLKQVNEPLQDVGANEGERKLYQYHAIMIEYLRGNLKRAVELFRQLGETIDPRRIATGLRGKGSTYFADELRKVIATPEKIAEFVTTKTDETGRFLLLAYMMAYPSKDTEPLAVKNLRPLVSDLPRARELLRIFSIAEAYRLSSESNTDKVRVVVSKLLMQKPFTAGINIEFYVKRYLTQSLKSNVVSEPPTEDRSVEAYTYCRICGTPMVDEGLRFIEYARDPEVRGGVSELWLPDDVPMSDLEGIAGGIRHICPLCFYEAGLLRGRYTPPFFVLTLHPAVAYDLWLWIEARVGNLAEIAPRVKERTKDFARLLASMVRLRSGSTDEDLKDYGKLDWRSGKVRELIEELLGDLRKSKKRPLVLFDRLGARLIVSTGGSYAVKRRDVALLTTLAPLFVSVAGGGQVGIVATLADSYNLGIAQAPIYVPHPVAFVDNIVRLFEEIRTHARRKGRDLRVEEYAVYNRSYLTVLLALHAYGLKVLGWWRAKVKAEVEDYAHKLMTYMSSIPYVPIALSAPPPPSLDPRDDPDSPLPNYVEITFLSRRVEELMGRASELAEGRRSIPLDRVLWEYAKNLAELTEPGKELSRTAVQKPLRRAIELLLQYADTLGEETSKNIVADIFLQQVASTAEVDIDKKVKKVEDKDVSYRLLMLGTFKRLADAVLELRRKLPPQNLRRLIEVLLDSAYEKYKQAKGQVKD